MGRLTLVEHQGVSSPSMVVHVVWIRRPKVNGNTQFPQDWPESAKFDPQVETLNLQRLGSEQPTTEETSSPE